MRYVLAILLTSTGALAESYVAIRTIPARAVLAASDIASVDAAIPGAVGDATLVLGQEARVTVFAGHPINAEDFAAPALVDRNQVVSLIYARGGLQIATEGRALGRAGLGQVVRVMNLASRTTVSGVVSASGTVLVATNAERE